MAAFTPKGEGLGQLATIGRSCRAAQRPSSHPHSTITYAVCMDATYERHRHTPTSGSRQLSRRPPQAQVLNPGGTAPLNLEGLHEKGCGRAFFSAAAASTNLLLQPKQGPHLPFIAPSRPVLSLRHGGRKKISHRMMQGRASCSCMA